MTQGVQALGSALLLSLMGDELLEINSSNYDEVSQIYTYSQLHKLIILYTRIIITIFSIRYCHSHALRLYRIVF